MQDTYPGATNHCRNLLVCGGMPRSATTFMHRYLARYSNCHKTFVKESYLFHRSRPFVDLKLKTLRKDKLYLDFTPTYIFDLRAVDAIYDRGISCFFILREFDDWRRSLSAYQSVNGLNCSRYLANVTRKDFESRVEYVKRRFLTVDVNEVTDNTEGVVSLLQSEFKVDLGRPLSSVPEKINGSRTRSHRTGIVFGVNNFPRTLELCSSALFGLL